MIKRVLLAAILTGLAAGFVMAVIQHVRLAPMIEFAETFEHASHGHEAAITNDQTVAAHSHGDETWTPTNGLERTFYSSVTIILAAIGFALGMTGVSFLTGTPITRSNGLIWGLCGFLAVSFAPALGLPPELPGMQGASFSARQLWWIGCILSTGFGLWIISTRVSVQHQIIAIVALLLPHLGLAPKAPAQQSPVPASLAAEFVTASLGANLVMWALIGLFLSIALARFADMEKS
jgi:cobalt transporter subunit CbtA